MAQAQDIKAGDASLATRNIALPAEFDAERQPP